MENINKLTELQATFGYVEGVVNPIALLGLLGEAGEVAEEFTLTSEKSIPYHELQTLGRHVGFYIGAAKGVEVAKKRLRAIENADAVVNITSENFNVELSDLLYYLNAVAIGRGLSLDELARISYEKVMSKRNVATPELRNKP